MQISDFVKEFGDMPEWTVRVYLLQSSLSKTFRVLYIFRCRAAQQDFAVMHDDFLLNEGTMIAALLNRKNQSIHPLHGFTRISTQVNFNTDTATRMHG